MSIKESEIFVNLDLLNDAHPDFVGFGAPAVHEKIKSSTYCGHHSGDVGFHSENL
jgi:hypothetical protein